MVGEHRNGWIGKSEHKRRKQRWNRNSPESSVSVKSQTYSGHPRLQSKGKPKLSLLRSWTNKRGEFLFVGDMGYASMQDPKKYHTERPL